MAAGALTSAAVVHQSAGVAGAADTTMTVWKLESDWGRPRGPHGKTRLRSKASRRAAAHRYALTRADAEAMNLHKCSFAPAVAVTVDAAAFTTLWDSLSYEWTSNWSGRRVRLLDTRHVDRLRGGTTLLGRALSPSAPTTPTTSARPGGTASETGSVPAGSANGARATAPRTLALTGGDSPGLVVMALGAVGAGIAALRARRRDPREVS